MAIDTAETRALFVCLALFGQIATQRMQEMHLPESVSRGSFLSMADTGHSMAHFPHRIQALFALGTNFALPCFFVRPVSGEVKGREII